MVLHDDTPHSRLQPGRNPALLNDPSKLGRAIEEPVDIEILVEISGTSVEEGEKVAPEIPRGRYSRQPVAAWEEGEDFIQSPGRDVLCRSPRDGGFGRLAIEVHIGVELQGQSDSGEQQHDKDVLVAFIWSLPERL